MKSIKKISKAILLAALLAGLLLLCACNEQPASASEPPQSGSEPASFPADEPASDTAQEPSEPDWETLYSTGMDCWEFDPDEAVSYFEQAIEADPTHPEPYDMLARYYSWYDKGDEAIACLEQGVEATNDSGLEYQLERYNTWWGGGDWYDTLMVWGEIPVNGVPFPELTAGDLERVCGANQNTNPGSYKNADDSVNLFVTIGSSGVIYSEDTDTSLLPESGRSLLVKSACPVDINGVTIGMDWEDALCRMGFSPSGIPSFELLNSGEYCTYSAIDARGTHQTASFSVFPDDGKMRYFMDIYFEKAPDWLSGGSSGDLLGMVRLSFWDNKVETMRLDINSYG